MAEAGITSAPEFMWMTPVREAIVWDREVPAMIITHHVEDFDAWVVGYDAADELQRSNGIIGQAANLLGLIDRGAHPHPPPPRVWSASGCERYVRIVGEGYSTPPVAPSTTQFNGAP